MFAMQKSRVAIVFCFDGFFYFILTVNFKTIAIPKQSEHKQHIASWQIDSQTGQIATDDCALCIVSFVYKWNAFILYAKCTHIAHNKNA